MAAALVLLTVVVVWSSWVNYRAWRATEKALVDYQATQQEKEERTRNAVPALVEAARLAVERRRYDNALTSVKLALDYDANHDEARLLKGQLLIVRKDFAAARAELERYLKRKPADAEARKLKELCGRSRPEDVGNLLLLAQVFARQEVPALAEGLLREHGGNSFEARKQLLGVYRKRIESAWPGLGDRLTMDNDGIYRLDFSKCEQVTSLAPLEGIPLTWLALHYCHAISDLSPLKGMPLTWLVLVGCKVEDLSPQKEMSLTALDLQGTPLMDLTPLRGMPLTSLNLQQCWKVTDLRPLRDTKLTRLVLVGCDQVTDLTPLRSLPLTHLDIAGCRGIKDLTPLAGLNLQTIRLDPKIIRTGMEVLRPMRSLRTIRVYEGDGKEREMTPEQFWKKYDAGEFKQYKP